MFQGITYLNQIEAAKVDQELFDKYNFSVEQLLELAGLAVAQAVNHSILNFHKDQKIEKILLVCGPGNNGGDGLVAARHLALMNYSCTVLNIKSPEKQLFVKLNDTCKYSGVDVLNFDQTFPDAQN